MRPAENRAGDHGDQGDPLPGQSTPEGRWGEPYLSPATGWWTARVLHPLTQEQRAENLQDVVMAPTRGLLTHWQQVQDRKFTQFAQRSAQEAG